MMQADGRRSQRSMSRKSKACNASTGMADLLCPTVASLARDHEAAAEAASKAAAALLAEEEQAAAAAQQAKQQQASKKARRKQRKQVSRRSWSSRLYSSSRIAC